MVKRSRPQASRAIVVLAAIAALVAACTASEEQPEDRAATEQPGSESTSDLRFEGPEDGQLINASDLRDLSFQVTASNDEVALDELVLLLDGEDVTGAAERDGSTLTYAPDTLADGTRSVEVAEASTASIQDAAAEAQTTEDATNDDLGVIHSWQFEVKAEPPILERTSPSGVIPAGDGVVVAGMTDPGATVAVGDVSVTADDDGAFELELPTIDGDITLVATDVAGNSAELVETVAMVPSRVEIDEIRTVHATFWAWATPSLREPILQMIDDGRINSVQLDLKDEGGHLGYDSQVPLAQEIGSGIGPLNLEQAVADLHERDVAVIGRIVAFADPALASWAWDNDRRDLVIQLPDGSDYYRGSYAGFSNYTHEDVIAYNLDIAEEAAKAGVDHILWDYIRRPEGINSYEVPGLTTTPEEAIVEFTRLADERLAPYGVQHGASVYGIAADRPTQIGQDIPAMAEYLDYVAPMLYPSHWGVGEYGVSDPNRQPYDIITATLEVWDEAVDGRRARVVPWFEDTPYRAWDRPFQIREQIRAAKDQGIDEWLMWNPGSTFTPQAYEQR